MNDTYSLYDIASMVIKSLREELPDNISPDLCRNYTHSMFYRHITVNRRVNNSLFESNKLTKDLVIGIVNELSAWVKKNVPTHYLSYHQTPRNAVYDLNNEIITTYRGLCLRAIYRYNCVGCTYEILIDLISVGKGD